jgi:hypothetical protein
MTIRFIDENLHAWLDYPVAASLMGTPFLLGLSNPIAIWLSFGTGVAALVLTLLTKHRFGVLRVLPYSLHLNVDRLVGLTFAVAPLVFGFTGLDAAYYYVNAAAVIAVTFLLNTNARTAQGSVAA